MRHWAREGPPVYIAVAACLGLREPRSDRSGRLDGQDLVNYLAAFPGGVAASPPEGSP